MSTSLEHKSLQFIFALFAAVKKTAATFVQMHFESDVVRIRLFKSRTGEGTTKWEILRELAIDPVLYRRVYVRLLKLSAHWPHVDDPQFHTSSPRLWRLNLSSQEGMGMAADVAVRNFSGGHTLSLSNFRFDADSVLDRLELNELDKAALVRCLSHPRGLVLTGCGSSPHAVDAGAIAVSLRPDAAFYPNINSDKEAQRALQRAEQDFVVVEVEGSDPLSLIQNFLCREGNFISARPLLVSALRMVFVHHRVPRICEQCKISAPLDPSLLERLPAALHPRKDVCMSYGKGCAACSQSGYRGSIGLNSIIELNQGVSAALGQGLSDKEVLIEAYANNTSSLLEDGLRKAVCGDTTFDAVLATTTFSRSYLDALREHLGRLQETTEDQDVTSSLSMSSKEFFDEQIEDELSCQPEKTSEKAEEDLEVSEALSGLDEAFFNKQSEAGSPDDALQLIQDKTTLLIVEDSDKQQKILEMIFKSVGFKILIANHGKEALGILNESPVDIVVSDVNMPVMDGVQFVKELRAVPSLNHLPVMMLTSETDPDIEYEVRSNGADDFCNKTVKRQALLERVENLLQRGNEEDALDHLLTD